MKQAKLNMNDTEIIKILEDRGYTIELVYPRGWCDGAHPNNGVVGSKMINGNKQLLLIQKDGREAYFTKMPEAYGSLNYHRFEDGPAHIVPGKFKGGQYFYTNGKKHRVDGPAFIPNYKSGVAEYWIDGEKIGWGFEVAPEAIGGMLPNWANAMDIGSKCNEFKKKAQKFM